MSTTPIDKTRWDWFWIGWCTGCSVLFGMQGRLGLAALGIVGAVVLGWLSITSTTPKR